MAMLALAERHLADPVHEGQPHDAESLAISSAIRSSIARAIGSCAS